MKVELSLPKQNWGDWHVHWSQKPINSDKSWDEIKDLLQLKLCNTNIHTYTSCFMELQQQEKESLAAYVHRFKTEAKRCNFTNDSTTIRIFIKELKNAHSLATCIYEKGPQMLTEAILEVEKLNAVQQLTPMIIPPSTVNVMSLEEDYCFQYQEQGHIAQNYSHIRYYECSEYGHIVMDCPHRIPLSGTPAIHHKPPRSCHARSRSRHHCEERDGQSQSRSQSHFRNHCSLSWCNSYRDCSRSQHWDGCSHHRSSSQWLHSICRGHSHQSCHDTPNQPHRRSSTHRSSSAYQSRDCSRSDSWPSYQSSRQDSHRSSSHSSRSWEKPHPKKNTRVKIEDPHMDYYSSNDHSSDLGGIWSFKLTEPSPRSDSHEQGGLPTHDQVTVALIMDCPTITGHAGKCYKALIDSGAAISLIRHSTYQVEHGRQITNDSIGNDSTSS